ncbi:DUF3048 domain-containing protein [Patescibacteria group bacterium]|nr:DUF3048 domain-containing protein [Patescibacteria group bacterium]
MSKKIIPIILISIAYIISTGISYTIFSAKAASTPSKISVDSTVKENENTGNDYQAKVFNQNKPKTEECPLNGAMYNKEQREWWDKHRPLGVMIENHKESRPQSGLSFADMTYEAVAEGGITRTLNIYYCQDAGIIGPIRSARTYFLDFVSEYGDYPLYAHVGGANTDGPADALAQIENYGWAVYNDLNQFSIGYPTFWRDQNRIGRDVATEHTMYSTTDKLWAVAEKRGLTNINEEGEPWDTSFVKYSFKDDVSLSERPGRQTVHVEFWNNEAYYVDWEYDKQNNTYLRKNGEQHIDRNTKKQLSAKNVVVLFMTERHADDGYEGNAHLLYGTKGQGKALIFLDGKQIKGTWKKTGRMERTIIYDESGEEIKFNRGKLWFEILSTDSVVKAS